MYINSFEALVLLIILVILAPYSLFFGFFSFNQFAASRSEYQKSFRVNHVIYALIERKIMKVSTLMQDGSPCFPNRTQLIKLKFKAMRAGVWFRFLPRIDRVLVDLTIKVTENIRSVNLAKSIFAVLGKLEELMESGISKSLRSVGRPLAEKLSLTAQGWGNTSAKGWATDRAFAYFLAVMHMNK
jgi:hypothetical protein